MQKQQASGPLERLASGLALVENACALLAGIALVVAVLLVSANALSRHVLSAPIEFQLELTQSYLLVMLITLALPWGFRQGGFIRITLFSGLFGPRWWQRIYQVGLLFSCAYLSVLGYEAFVVFADAWVKRHMIMGIIDWPVAWSWVWIPIGCWLLALRTFLMALGAGEQPEGH
jgi:TRAP-type C4-dicarboxylate transport system permease small subunit